MSSNFQQQQQSMPSPLVWFLLLDSATGEPYKGTSADYVSLPPGSVIAQFREAAKAKHQNKLSSVDAADLLVYKNKAAFDKRNASVDDGKEVPLEEDFSIDGLGKSKKEALVVVVPLPILPSQIQSSSFPPCDFPFFKSIYKATESDGWISFGHTIPSTSLENLFIRESYRTIASSIYPGINKAIITGTPGIGKSLFLVYLLWILAREGERVLFIYHPFSIYFDGKGGVYSLARGLLPLENDASFWNDTLWCLFDAKLKKEADLGYFPFELCKFILSTSPRRELVNDFQKPPVPQVYYMPTWSEAELEAIAPYFANAENVWRERYEILGGIPRHVLEVTTRTPTVMLKSACTNCSLDDCIKMIGVDSEISEHSKVIHLLVHVTSTTPYTNSSVCFASQTALDIIVREKGKEAKLKMRELIAACEGNRLTAALCGYIFEPHAIELLEAGGQFKYRQLVHGNKRIKPDEKDLTIPWSSKIVVDKVMPNQTQNQLYVPKSKNYTAIDAWIPGIGAFQMTVGKKHDIKGGAKEDLAMLGDGNKLFWLLPPLNYQSFTKQSPHDIDQYAMLIPYPE
ncbi:hypothetical protein MP228_001104 [Amoeboaphelidium protococcarum]|nr:hypothetical protein MP228_001900 [Amoeboaphelidium protococcarum]KAI3654385.1 hypothetical protein MP228_001104 [Amoeboaphelidium protococcarum]